MSTPSSTEPCARATLRSASRTGRRTIAQITNAYQSQLELPVLFYLVVISRLLHGAEPTTLLVLAWAFVATRLFHALVHVTTNHMGRRFFAFFAGSMILLAMWILFTLDLFVGSSGSWPQEMP